MEDDDATQFQVVTAPPNLHCWLITFRGSSSNPEYQVEGPFPALAIATESSSFTLGGWNHTYLLVASGVEGFWKRLGQNSSPWEDEAYFSKEEAEEMLEDKRGLAETRFVKGSK